MAVGDKKFQTGFLDMDIEAELPEDFESMSAQEKVEELESLKEKLEDDSDAGAVKKRILGEMIRKYSD